MKPERSPQLQEVLRHPSSRPGPHPAALRAVIDAAKDAAQAESTLLHGAALDRLHAASLDLVAHYRTKGWT